MKVIEKNTGKKLTVIGIERSKKDNRILLQIKGWKSNCLLELSAATSLTGDPLTESMFISDQNLYVDIFNALMWVNGQQQPSVAWQDLISEIIVRSKNANTFVQDVANSVWKYAKCSPKQANILAKFASENGVSI